MRLKLTTVVLCTALAIGCSSGSNASNATQGSASPPSTTTSQPTTTAPTGTPMPEGVFVTSFPLEVWTAAGLPASTYDGFKHEATFENGSLRDICVYEDGSRHDCLIGSYSEVGDHEAEFKYHLGSFRIRWQFDGAALTFTFDPGEGQTDDHVVWSTNPWTKVG